jgi:hypothetical protein
MSYTSFECIATCKVSCSTVEEVAEQLSDWVANNLDHEEIKNGFLQGYEDYTYEEVVDSFTPFLSFNAQGELVIHVDSESDEGNYNSEIWNFLINHIAYMQTSKLMKVVGMSDDSRMGMDASITYYDQGGSCVCQEEIIQYYIDNKLS